MSTGTTRTGPYTMATDLDLLERYVTDGDARAFAQLATRHRDMVYATCYRVLGNRADAEDAAQETMATFFKAFRDGKYDPCKGRLSNWLFGIAKRVILNLRGRQPLEHLIADKATGTSFWDMVQDDKTLGRAWELEWQQMVMKRCLEQVRQEYDPKVFGAFRHYAIDQFAVEEVCQKFDMSRNAVYIAKSRVLSRLRELRQRFE